MDEPELDDNQVDPYHGNQSELPEPEPMDLPDDLQFDEQEDERDTAEENPFDIDKQKGNFHSSLIKVYFTISVFCNTEEFPADDQMESEIENKPEESDKTTNDDDQDSDESDSEVASEKQDPALEGDTNEEDLNKQETENIADEHNIESNEEKSGLDEMNTNENTAHGMEVEQSSSADNVLLKINYKCSLCICNGLICRCKPVITKVQVKKTTILLPKINLMKRVSGSQTLKKILVVILVKQISILLVKLWTKKCMNFRNDEK